MGWFQSRAAQTICPGPGARGPGQNFQLVPSKRKGTRFLFSPGITLGTTMQFNIDIQANIDVQLDLSFGILLLIILY